jgi:NitT/TauT family transport system permease protein
MAENIPATTEERARWDVSESLVILYVGRLVIGLVFCVIWWSVVHFGLTSEFFISTPIAVGRYLYENFLGEILRHGIYTLSATIIAFSLSAIAGITFGLVLVEVPFVRKLVDPYLTAMNSMPRIALAPIFILWFGIGFGSKIALAFSLGFFIVLNSTVAGMRNLDPILMRLSHTLGCSSLQRFWKISMPWAVPSIFAGLKLALIYSFLGVVTSEMIASREGLGNLVMFYSGIYRVDAVLGILLAMAVCAAMINLFGDYVESKLVGVWTDPSHSMR